MDSSSSFFSTGFSLPFCSASMARICCTFRLAGLPLAWRAFSFCRFSFSCARAAGRGWRSCCSFFFSARGVSLGGKLCPLMMFRIGLGVRLQSRACSSKRRMCGGRRKVCSCAIQWRRSAGASPARSTRRRERSTSRRCAKMSTTCLRSARKSRLLGRSRASTATAIPGALMWSARRRSRACARVYRRRSRAWHGKRESRIPCCGGASGCARHTALRWRA